MMQNKCVIIVLNLFSNTKFIRMQTKIQLISGLGATTFALTMGLAGFVRGSPNQRFWMWSRVGAQGGTIAALLVSAYYAGIRQQEKGKNAVSTHEPLSK